MKQNTVLIVIIAILVGGILGYALTKNDDYEMGGMMEERGERDKISFDDMPMSGMDHSMMMVSSEKEFLQGMIPHHQEAVDTAKEVIERGGSTPEIKALAEAIVVAQEKEIAEMKGWYQDWYGETYEPTGEYREMMRELENLSGAELDRRFLEDMIMHHMGAIMMAQSVQPHIEHEEITNLTQAIKVTQSKEIDLMRDLLRDLN